MKIQDYNKIVGELKRLPSKAVSEMWKATHAGKPIVKRGLYRCKVEARNAFNAAGTQYIYDVDLCNTDLNTVTGIKFYAVYPVDPNAVFEVDDYAVIMFNPPECPYIITGGSGGKSRSEF